MSQQSTPILQLSLVASGAVTGGRFVDFAGAQIASSGANALGVAAYTVATGKSFPAVVVGTAIAESGAAVSLGDAIQSDGSGRAITVASGAKLGRALQAATAAGQFIEVLLVGN